MYKQYVTLKLRYNDKVVSLIIKANEMHNISILFDKILYMIGKVFYQINLRNCASRWLLS